MKKMPKTLAITLVEGGPWVFFDDMAPLERPDVVHAIRFADGSIWDTKNGWRGQENMSPTPRTRSRIAAVKG